MKTSKTVLDKLLGDTQFKPLNAHKCYVKFLSLLPRHLQKAIAFVYIKNETLFIALKHPGFKMELHYNKDLLKSLLTTMGKYDKECCFENVSKVAAFHSKYHQMPKMYDSTPCYFELAQGEFEVSVANPKIKEHFEKIKEIIKCNRL
ncbi:MAG: hypothetical protein JXQ68_05500 [Campylobacterales bacterium]|nr:hypothetical protein [Campylobacterales bacterium]